ncbi:MULTISPECIES: cytochrome c oxidase subunit II [unclassified Coleofasciculus]|uniref:cytochrome c oxidase subunit II n=1 Tax=unclassified Coleofasciculus TaxID=2692782 RepID=UPI001881EAB8|nr:MULTISPECIES: cytochrome c oxidase subunit II [unclassified Coleofasciculus]MBE9124850.1 cytochrome c oxidase subunit II [Coleofasciculus sp. LEGE 07081]MBE9147755.1 cytochrome c oxidase subunit II [Coleofasciculus sp. LEGE 07092]
MQNENQKEKVPGAILTLTAGILVTLISLWYGQNHGLLPEQASEQAPLVDNFFNLMMTICTALFLVVEGTIIIALIKFRRRQGDDTDGEPIIGNLPLEAFWTAIPAIIVIGLGIYSVEVYRDMGGFEPAHHHMARADTPAQVAEKPGTAIASPASIDPEAVDSEGAEVATPSKYGFGAAPQREGNPADLVVNVSGLQFAWIFTYPESGITSGELHVPLNKDVQINITAVDVIHSFWVPQFRLKQDALPGQQTELRFVATKPGIYPIVCAELCGSYHGSMNAQLFVHPPEEYQTWVEENRIAGQSNQNQTVAVNPAELSESEFLAPYAKEMGIDANLLGELHSAHE